MATPKSAIRCETPECVSSIQKYGEHYHSVYDREEDGKPYQHCERCGGKHQDGAWNHTCRLCGTQVAPGGLMGFFVPHRCAECDAKVVAKERAEGRFCRRCNTVSSYCCC